MDIPTKRFHLKRLSQHEWYLVAPLMYGYSYRQAWAFGEASARRIGGLSDHIGLFQGADCVGIADVRVRLLPVMGGGVAYVSGGPLVRLGAPESMESLFNEFLNLLVEEFVQRKGLSLRIAPPVEWAAEGRLTEPVFNRSQFVTSERLRRYRTIMIDLRPSLEQLRKNINQKWRNCLNRAEKNGLNVESGSGVELLDRFCILHRELMDRKEFDVDLSVEFYRAVQNDMAAADKLRIKLVVVDGKDVAGHVCSTLGQTSVYLLGASNHVGNELKASYQLQWMTLMEAKESGCTWYDLGGIDPVANPGVFLFKERMGGMDVTADGPFELRPKGIRGRVTRWAEHLYRTIRRRQHA